MLFYVLVYALATMGSFCTLAYLGSPRREFSGVEELSGLARSQPLAAAALAIFMFSLTGIPPLAGFWAKWYVIQAALQVGGWLSVLAVLVVLNAVAAAFYYLRVAVYMYMRDPAEGASPVTVGGATRAGLSLAAIGTVAIGLIPPVTIGVIVLAERAAQALL